MGRLEVASWIVSGAESAGLSSHFGYFWEPFPCKRTENNGRHCISPQMESCDPLIIFHWSEGGMSNIGSTCHQTSVPLVPFLRPGQTGVSSRPACGICRLGWEVSRSIGRGLALISGHTRAEVECHRLGTGST